MTEGEDQEDEKKDRWWHHLFDGCCVIELFVILIVFAGVPVWWFV